MKFLSYVFIFIYFCVTIPVSDALRILIVIPEGGNNHYKIYEQLIDELASRNRQVTVITRARGFDNERLNIRVIDYGTFGTDRDYPSIDMQQQSSTFFRTEDSAWDPFRTSENGLSSCREMLLDYEYITEFYTDSSDAPQFDVIVSEVFDNECVLVFADLLKVPLVSISSRPLKPWYHKRIGHPSLYPNYLGYGANMTFLERVKTVLQSVWNTRIYNSALSKHQKSAEKILQRKFTSFDDLRKKINFFLVNSPFTMRFQNPMVPAVIDISGIHIKRIDELPTDIEDFYDEHKFVVYISMGTMIKGNTFPPKMLQIFLDITRQLRLGVLWKWDADKMEDQPSHVMIKRWFPQNDILAHRRTVMFISHAGLLGVIEALHYGVPMMAIPQFGDQFANAKALEALGLGITINLQSDGRVEIHNAFLKMMESEHRFKWREFKKHFTDRPNPPVDTAVYWIEYVAKHKGAPHLKGADMPLLEYLFLDVWLYLIVLLLTPFLLIYIGLIFYRRMSFRRSMESATRRKRK